MTEGVDVAALMRELSQRANSIDDASSKLMRATQAYEGWYDETESVDPSTGEILKTRGDWHPGPQLLWDVAVTEAAEEIAQEYEKADKRVPAAERLRSKAEIRVKATQEDLWVDYHRLRIEIDALTKWISARTKTLSARQSVLSAEKALVNG